MLILAITIITLFVLYWRCLDYYFLIDDIVRRWGYLYIVPESSPPPEFFSTKPHPWRHLWLIITHALNTWLVYLLFGWPAAVLFAFHPMNVTCTAWITGGYYSLTTFFVLTAFFFIQTFPNWIGGLIGATFFTTALGSTITCLGFPFIFLFVGNKWGLLFFWPLIMYVFGRRFMSGYKIRNMSKQDSITPRKLVVMTKTVAYYIRIMVYPRKLAFFRQYGSQFAENKKVRKHLEAMDKEFWIALGICLTFFFIGWQFSPLGTMWFFCTIGVFSQFKVLGQFIAERYMYLPIVGWSIILGTALTAYPIILFAIAAVYLYRAHLYIPAFEKMETLYLNGIKNYPRCVANYANLGERYLHLGKVGKAFKMLEKGLKIDQYSFLCLVNMAALYTMLPNSLHLAEEYTRRAIKYTHYHSRGFKSILGWQIRRIRETEALLQKSRAISDKEQRKRLADQKEREKEYGLELAHI